MVSILALWGFIELADEVLEEKTKAIDRPALWELVNSNPRTSNFPSGHAMMSLVIYGLIGYLLGKRFPQWRWWIFIGIMLLVTAIGFSRLDLGIHWPTDIVAGYAAGLIWLALSILYLEVRWKRRSQSQRVNNLSSPSS